MHDDRFRELVLDDPDDPLAVDHAAACPPCAALAERVRAIRRVAPMLAAPSRDGITEAVMLRLGSERRTFRRLLLPRLAVAAAAVLVVAIAVPAATRDDAPPGPAETDLSDALLVTAQRTEEAGSARLHLEGTTEVTGEGRTIAVAFGGVGALTNSRLRYRGLARVGDVLLPCELTVIGADAWTRRADGMWLRVAEPVGALAPVVLDAGSILELLRMPKDDVRLVAEDAATRTVAFAVNGRPGLVYEIVATVGRDGDLLRRVDLVASTAEWSTRATMRLYGFGEPVTIRPPPELDVVGTWSEPDDGEIPTRALFPVG